MGLILPKDDVYGLSELGTESFVANWVLAALPSWIVNTVAACAHRNTDIDWSARAPLAGSVGAYGMVSAYMNSQPRVGSYDVKRVGGFEMICCGDA